MTAPAPMDPSPPAEDRPAHYRLSNDVWELILKEYREGATAPFLASKWRVSQHAVRKRITEHRSTKRAWGDEQALTQVIARQAELTEARRNRPEAVTARLFEPRRREEDGADDPEALMEAAVLASGRAMKGRLWTEAKALAGLAETYARLIKKREAAELTPEDIPLKLLAQITAGPSEAWFHRMVVEDWNDPERKIKDWFHRNYRDRR